ncbi:MAG: hypothetical protein N0A00_00135 [Candidatus Bathyarchaeota archaeon]|nr:hypothetical protein [Candidatus Bathyarchaeota archaeon]
MDDELISCLLGFIARDSSKHAECFNLIGKWLSGNIGADFEICEQVWGETWKTIVVDAENFLSKREMRSGDLVLLISGLMKIESFVAEEYLTMLHVKLVELMAEGRKTDLGHFKKVLEWIAEDEKRHQEILNIIKGLLVEKRK